MARNSRNSVILHDAGDTAGLTAIEEVKNISGPDGSAAQMDATHLTSTGKEYLADFPDFGTVTLTCNLTYGTKQMDLFDMFTNSSDAAPFRIDHPGAAGVVDHLHFDGIVTKWTPTAAVGSVQGLSITIKVTGAVTHSSS